MVNNNYEEYLAEEYLMGKVCPECGTQGRCELIQTGFESYKCQACGHEGDLQEDIDTENYFWDELEYFYSEGDKGEVFDKVG